MKKITKKQFNRIVDIKKYKGKWDAYITWDGLDMYELAKTPQIAKEKLFRRINKLK